MIYIFKTSVSTQQQAEDLIGKFSEMMPDSKCTFDLEDCDKILRVEGGDMSSAQIGDVLRCYGFECLELQE